MKSIMKQCFLFFLIWLAPLFCSSTGGYIDIYNSTKNPLKAHETFVGPEFQVLDYSVLVTTFYAEPMTATGTLFLEFSQDKIHWDRSVVLPISNPTEESPHSSIPVSKYYRVRYENGPIDQTALRIQSIYHKQKSKGLTARIEQKINENTDVDNVRAVIVGRDRKGNYKNVEISSNRSLGVEITNQRTAFGEISVAMLNPVIQLQWPYNINSKLIRTSTTETGTASINSSRLKLSTGTTAQSKVIMQSKQLFNYQPGEGGEVRFSAVFNEGVVGTDQLIGIGDAENGLFFGYQGQEFGILKRSHGKIEIRTLTLTKESSKDGTITIKLNGGQGVVVSVSKNDTIGEITKKIADANYNNEGEGFTAYYAGNKVVFTALTSGSRSGTYSLKTNSTKLEGSFTQDQEGITANEIWIPQTNWSEDVADGSNSLPALDPTKGNVYRVQFQWLGYGMLYFGIEDPQVGPFFDIHQIEYSNVNTVPSLGNPSMPLYAYVSNNSTTENITLYTSSMAAFVQGIQKNSSMLYSASHYLEVKKYNEESPLLSIRVKNSIHSTTNKVRVLIDSLTFGNNADSTATFKLYKNAYLSGEPIFSDKDTNDSFVQVAKHSSKEKIIDGTGNHIFTSIVGKENGTIKECPKSNIELFPGDLITITGNTSDKDAVLETGLTWIEDF